MNTINEDLENILGVTLEEYFEFLIGSAPEQAMALKRAVLKELTRIEKELGRLSLGYDPIDYLEELGL